MIQSIPDRILGMEGWDRGSVLGRSREREGCLAQCITTLSPGGHYLGPISIVRHPMGGALRIRMGCLSTQHNRLAMRSGPSAVSSDAFSKSNLTQLSILNLFSKHWSRICPAAATIQVLCIVRRFCADSIQGWCILVGVCHPIV